jgi:GNAT superfamily N-acetyltransferase
MGSIAGHTIRPACLADADAAFLLAREFATSFTVEETSFRRTFGELLSSPSACFLVAELDEVVVGYVLGFSHPTFFANGRVAWVEELMVAEAYRRKGIGEALMDALARWAEERGCRMVALATRRASEFYAALGYEASATYFRKSIGAAAKT